MVRHKDPKPRKAKFNVKKCVIRRVKLKPASKKKIYVIFRSNLQFQLDEKHRQLQKIKQYKQLAHRPISWQDGQCHDSVTSNSEAGEAPPYTATCEYPATNHGREKPYKPIC